MTGIAKEHKAEHQLQTLGIFVHGVLFAFHALGIVYNAKRRNWFDVAAHTAAGSYDLYAVNKHIRHAKELNP